MPESFDVRKIRLATDLLKELDDVLAGGEIARKTSSTGGVHVTWSKRYSKRAGLCRSQYAAIDCKIDDEVYQRNLKLYGHAEDRVKIRTTKYNIRLAEKLVTDEKRLMDVVAHEWCHLAASALSGVSNDKHGSWFWYWAEQVHKHFAHRGIKVTKCHDYLVK